MKPFNKKLVRKIVSFMLFISLYHPANARSPVTYSLSEITSIITSHQWSLVEIIQSSQDTSTNMTLFMMPCEKDNNLVFNNAGTYQILEGSIKCNAIDNDIKGQGKWEYDEQNTLLIDSYEGGMQKEKRILSIDNDLLKVQYEGEGKKIFTLTYFSETGKKSESNIDLIIDNSDPSQNITQTIKENLSSANRYVLVGKKDIDTGVRLSLDDKGGMCPEVAIIQLVNNSDINQQINISERNKSLLEQGMRAGVDYIVTGSIIDAKAEKGPNGSYLGRVKYEIQILEVSSGNIIPKIFEYDAKKQSNTPNLGTMIKTVGNLAALGSLWYFREAGWNSLYSYYFISNTSNAVGTSVNNVFSTVNNEERKKHYETSIAIINSISHTEKDLNAFVIENTPLKIKIISIDVVNKKKEVTIEAGSNVNLKVNEKLKVIKLTSRTLSNGTQIQDKLILGELKVTNVKSYELSSCSIVKGSDDVEEAFKQSPKDIILITTEGSTTEMDLFK